MTSRPVEPRRPIRRGRSRTSQSRVGPTATTWYRFEPVYYRLYHKLKQNVFYSVLRCSWTRNTVVTLVLEQEASQKRSRR